MTIFTECGHCSKTISFDLPDKEVQVDVGKARLICKVECEKCKRITDVMVALLPVGEKQ